MVDVGEGIRAGARRLGVSRSRWIDLGLDHAGVAVVDRPQNRDRASVPPGMPDEQLSRGRSPSGCRLAHVPAWPAFWAACATVSLSTKPVSRPTRAAGRV